MWVSLRLVLIGAIVGTLLGVAAGAYGAVKQYQLSDRLLTVFSFVDPVDSRGRARRALQECRHRPQQPARVQALLYTTGEITPGLDPWSCDRHRQPPRAPRAAVAGADRDRRRLLRPLPAQRDARRARQRLPAHRPRQGPEPSARADQAWPAHGAHPDGHVLRLRVRAAVRRRHLHREGCSAGTAWASTSSTRSPRTT